MLFTFCNKHVLAQADLKPYIYLHSSEFPPSYEDDNVINRESMNTVFGEDNWWEAYFESTPAIAIFNDTTCMVYLEATGYYCASLENYLYTNYDLIHAWVAQGGGLLLV